MTHVDLTNVFEEGTTRADYQPFSDWATLAILSGMALPTILAAIALFN